MGGKVEYRVHAGKGVKCRDGDGEAFEVRMGCEVMRHRRPVRERYEDVGV